VLVAAAGLLVGGLALLVSRAPKPDANTPLAQAEALIGEEKYEQAIALLNDRVLPLVGGSALDAEGQRRYHLLVGRALYRGQRALGISREDNNNAIAQQFAEAERASEGLDPPDLYAYADTLLALGQIEAALARADQLPASMNRQRVSLYRAIVDKTLAAAAPQFDRALELIGRVRSGTELTQADAVWAAARQTELLVNQGYGAEAIAKLLPLLPGFESAPDRERGELFALLGRAYLEGMQIEPAVRHLERARALLPPDDTALGAALVALGRARSLGAAGEAPEQLALARESYAAAVTGFADPRVQLPALLGLAEVESRLSMLDGSATVEECLTTYARLVEAVRAGQAPGANSVTAAAVGKSLLARFRERFDSGRPEDGQVAVRFVALAETLFPFDQVDPEILLALAEANLRAADERLPVEPGPAGAIAEGPRLDRLDPATRSEVKQRLLSAGDYYRRHSQAVVISDAAAYGRSLWQAAIAYDRAGNQPDAIASLQEFLAAFPEDARTPEARFRLARAHQMRGEIELAVSLFRDLIGARDGQTGPFGDASFVPLAQALLADADPANDPEAVDLLTSVLSGRLGGVDNPHFRPALLTLGEHAYASGDYTGAIESLGQAVERFSTDPLVHVTRFRLADANRRSAQAIEEQLAEAMPDQERRTLEGLRDERLRTALGLFERVRDDLEGVDPRRRSGLEELCLRQAYFAVGDCAFALGEYDMAIRAYDAARERSNRRPDALVALVQIVSAHLKQGDLTKAATAQQRAKSFYLSIPPEVWQESDHAMTKAAWERWLESTEEIGRLAGGSADQNPQGPDGVSGPSGSDRAPGSSPGQP
jgi:tetratricopeptide (TPR) repeat protein